MSEWIPPVIQAAQNKTTLAILDTQLKKGVITQAQYDAKVKRLNR